MKNDQRRICRPRRIVPTNLVLIAINTVYKGVIDITQISFSTICYGTLPIFNMLNHVGLIMLVSIPFTSVIYMIFVVFSLNLCLQLTL